MKKLLFLQEKEKKELVNSINKQLETKNRLLKLVMINTNKKTSPAVSREKRFRYENQIIILETMKGMVISCNSREQLQKVNELIDQYNSLN